MYLCVLLTHLLEVFVISSPIIQQSPEHLLLNEKEKVAKIRCHHGDNSYQYMYWYQQNNKVGHLELIGMLSFDAHYPEEKFKTRFNITGHTARNAFLVISNISREDTATYFCAASLHSHSVFHTP